MRKFLSILGLCLLITGLTSCERAIMKNKIKRMVSEEIVLPEHLEEISKGRISEICGTDLSGPKLIIFVDSTECNECRISKFIRYFPLYEESVREEEFSLILLLSPKKKDIGFIREYLLLDEHYPIPVYLDHENAFRKNNTAIPDDNRFHSFYTNASGFPVFIGDPTASDRMMAIFRKAMKR